MPCLLQNERERAVGIFQAGMTQTEIANHFNCSRMTIYRLLVRVRATGTTSDRRRSGRPRETTLRQDRHITLIHLRNRFVTVVDTARRSPRIRNNRISDQTVRNRLRQSGLRSRRPLKGMELTGLLGFNGHVHVLGGGETLGRTFCFLMNPSLI